MTLLVRRASENVFGAGIDVIAAPPRLVRGLIFYDHPHGARPHLRMNLVGVGMAHPLRGSGKL
jgi:hypothetical protein